jgi:hypothetical protein
VRQVLFWLKERANVSIMYHMWICGHMGGFELLRFVAGVGEFLLGLYIIGRMHTTWRMSRIKLIDVSLRVLG